MNWATNPPPNLSGATVYPSLPRTPSLGILPVDNATYTFVRAEHLTRFPSSASLFVHGDPTSKEKKQKKAKLRFGCLPADRAAYIFDRAEHLTRFPSFSSAHRTSTGKQNGRTFGKQTIVFFHLSFFSRCGFQRQSLTVTKMAEHVQLFPFFLRLCL